MTRLSPDHRDIRNESFEIVRQKAELLLAMVGLRVDDLKGFARVVDFGAGDCYIERAARQNGLTNVLSLANKFPDYLKRQSLNLYAVDAANTGLQENSCDLVICRSSPLLLTKSENETLEILREIQRILQPARAMRIQPARFGFLEKRLTEESENFFNALGKQQGFRSSRDEKVIADSRLKANNLTKEFLSQNGFSFTEHEVTGIQGLSQDAAKYLVISK